MDEIPESTLFEWGRANAACVRAQNTAVPPSQAQARPARADCVILELGEAQREELAPVLHRGYRAGRAMFGQMVRDQTGVRIAFATLSRKTWGKIVRLINEDPE